MTFERKRILLSDFVLPSFPFIDGKTFIDCEIVGPANIHLQHGNFADPIRRPIIDVVWLAPRATFYNGIVFTNCIFRNCSFQRVTIFSGLENFEGWKNTPHINWISIPPTAEQIQQRHRIIANEPEPELKIIAPEKPARIRAPKKKPAAAS